MKHCVNSVLGERLINTVAGHMFMDLLWSHSLIISTFIPKLNFHPTNKPGNCGKILEIVKLQGYIHIIKIKLHNLQQQQQNINVHLD